MIEFATVGREGTTDVPIALGLDNSNMALISQVLGQALRMRRSDFLNAIASSLGLARAVLCYSGVMYAFLAQWAACNRAHHVDERDYTRAPDDPGPVRRQRVSHHPGVPCADAGVSRPSVALSVPPCIRLG